MHPLPLLPSSVPPFSCHRHVTLEACLRLWGPGLNLRNGRTESCKELGSHRLWGAELLHMSWTSNLWAFPKERNINFSLRFPVNFSPNLNPHQQRSLREELGVGPGPADAGVCCNYDIHCLIVLFILATLRCPLVFTRNCWKVTLVLPLRKPHVLRLACVQTWAQDPSVFSLSQPKKLESSATSVSSQTRLLMFLFPLHECS